ncbi:MAG: hypothetical protein BGO49_20550 [Planctomycetales bacterium 71-10]|nr:MAG: hypothetical protein BGO49_20550 [Planctomycetales bacterium 71-10]
MPGYAQARRPFTLTTPLGPDKLFLLGLSGREAISQLFRFDLDLIAEREVQVPFEQLLGKKVTAHVGSGGGETRHFSGVCSRMVQGGRDEVFTHYQMEVVPEAWFLTRRTQSRIFQRMSTPDILKKVFQGLAVEQQLQGKYEPREYCVQYRETDFDFASRLMEEEGIFYFFKHEQAGGRMILGDDPSKHPEVPFGSQVEYQAVAGPSVQEERITALRKSQELRSMSVVLWDHNFELPHKNLEAVKPIQDAVQVGSVSHKLKLGDAARLELYDWPGGYARRYDGVGPGGDDKAADLNKVFVDNKRTASLRMEEEAAAALELTGESRCRQFTAGQAFEMKKHFNADGKYVLTSVVHSARTSSDYRSGDFGGTAYENAFSCIPASVPFRPRRVTPRPVVAGTQTAVVVGPSGREIFTDKYGRVKVQFHWDREGKKDQNSSCWVRVAQPIAGRRWGSSFWPRIGQEVVVHYLEGDVDRPIIIGAVYNPEQLPAYLDKGPDSKHKEENLLSGFKSNTSDGGEGFNELRFYDAKDKQQIFLHAERDYDARVKNDAMEWIQHDRHTVVGKEDEKSEAGDHNEEIWRDHNAHIHRNRVEHVEKDVQLLVGGGVDVDVTGTRTESVGGDEHLTVRGERHEKIATNNHTEAGQEIHLKAGMKVVIEAGMELTIKAGGGFIKLDAMGVTIEGTMVKINCGGAATPAKPAKPESPKKAAPKKPKEADDAVSGSKSC